MYIFASKVHFISLYLCILRFYWVWCHLPDRKCHGIDFPKSRKRTMINFELLERDKVESPKNGLVWVKLGNGKVARGYPIDDVHHYQAKMCKYASHVPKVNYCKFLCYICLLIVSGSIMRIIFIHFCSSSHCNLQFARLIKTTEFGQNN